LLLGISTAIALPRPSLAYTSGGRPLAGVFRLQIVPEFLLSISLVF
jgi:hypothetical protein